MKSIFHLFKRAFRRQKLSHSLECSFDDFKQRAQKEICFEKPSSMRKFMKQKSDRQLNVIFCSRAYFFSKHFILLISWWCHIMRPSEQVFFFEINLLSNFKILRLILGDWTCSGILNRFFWWFGQNLICQKVL